MEKNKLLVICGPTATGKTQLGVDLAKKFDGEIISADSRQVYKGNDIATGKDKELYGEIKVWGIDLVDKDYNFNVSEYVRYAQRVIRNIWQRGKLPIVVGGTGLYIKELLEPSETLHIPPDNELRKSLLYCSIVELQKKLQKINKEKWEVMNNSDRQNPRRLIRAIEVEAYLRQCGRTLQGKVFNFDTLIIGLTAPRGYLYQKIDVRVEKRIKLGVNRDQKSWQNVEHGLARRQLTYFKKLSGINWFNVTNQNYHQEVIQKVSKWYN